MKNILKWFSCLALFALPASAATVPVLTVDEDNVTSTTAPLSWTACDNVVSYTVQLASDTPISVGGSGGSVTVFTNAATAPASAPIGWTYNIYNNSGAYLQLTTPNHYVVSDIFDTEACVNLSLSLKARTFQGTATGSTNLLVQYSFDDGGTWTPLGTVSASTTTLTPKSLNADAAIGHPSVRFRFSVPEASGTKGLGISDIKLTGTEESTAGNVIRTLTVSGTSTTLTGLTPEFYYGVRVKGHGDWSDDEAFITLASSGGTAPSIAAVANQTATLGGNDVEFVVTASGDAPITFSVDSADAPEDTYEINATSGRFYFMLTETGTFHFTITAVNSAGSDTESFTVTVNSSTPSGTAPSIDTIGNKTYVYGANNGIFAFTVGATGTPAPTFSVTSSDAPSGSYTIGPNDGEFIFEPVATGTFHFTVTAANGVSPNATASFTVTVTGTAPVVTVTPATYAYNVTVGDPYVEFAVAASGNPAPVLTDSCTEGAYYVFENGAFLFEPDTVGTYHFVFIATNSVGSDSKTVTVTVSSAPVATYSVQVASGIQNGTVSVSAAQAAAGDTVTVTATPASGYKLEAITVNGSPITGNTFTMPAAAVTVSATFVESTAVTAIYTVASKTNVTVTGTVPAGSSATFASTYNTLCQLTSGNSMTLTLSGYNGATITGLTLSMRSNGSGGGGTLNATCGNATIASIADSKFNTANWHGSWSTNYVDVNPTVTATTIDGNVVITIAATANSLYCRSFTIEYEPGTPSGDAPAWSSIPAQTVAVGQSCDLDLANYVSGTAPIAISMADTEHDAVLVGTEFSFTPDTVGTYTFSFTAANDSGSADATLTVTATGTAPVVTVTPATYAYNVTAGDPYVEFTVTASGNPAPVLTDTCPENAYYVFENNAFLFDPDTAGTYHFVFAATNSEGSDSKTVTVTVASAAVPAPTLTISNETDTTADASWTAVSGATAYTLQLASDNLFSGGLLSENFSKIAASNGTAVANFDNVTQTAGWSGEYAYPHPGALRMGNTSKAGSLQTPALTASGSITVSWTAYRWDGDTPTVAVGVSEDGGTTFSEQTVALTDTATAYSHTFALSGSSAIVRWRATAASKKRFFLDDISVTSSSGSLISSTTSSSTSHTFTGLDPFTVYYARVKADEGEWSTVVDFITDQASGTAPSIGSIADQTYIYGSGSGDFELTVTATGDPAPEFSVASSDAPAGSFDIDENTGFFFFTPASTGTFHFTVTATNGVSPDATASFAVTVTGTVPAVTPVADKTITLEDGGVEFQVVATGNPPPAFTATSTTAPAGTYDVDASGVFTFTPDAEGTFFFIVTASNSLGSSSISFAVTVAPSVAPVPELTVANVTTTTADASWTAITGALSYTLQLGTDYDFTPASGYAEDFSSFASASYSADLASQTVAGRTWSYEYVKMSPGGATNGVGTKGYAQLQASNGHLYLPSIDNPAKIVVVARATGGALALQQQVGGTWTTIDSFTLEPTGTAHTHAFANAGTAVALRLVAGANTTYVHDVSVVCADGTLVEEVTIPGWSHTFTNLSPSTLYCTRVKADNSDWSEVELFETAAPAGTAPTLSAVEDQTISLEDGGLEFTVTATGTPAPTFSVTSSDAPAGTFTIGENDGVFLFTAESEGTFHFTVTAANGVSPDATVSFAVTVVSSVLPAPVLAIANVTETTANASWTAVAGASAYTLQLGSDANFTAGPGYAEDFTSFPSATSYVTNSQNVASGTWTYDGAKFTPGGAANGEGSKGYIALRANGTLDLPAINHPSKVTVVARVASGTGTLKLQQYVSGSWSDIETWTISDSGTAYSHSFANAGTAVALRLTGGKVTTIHDVSVASADGSLLEEISLSGLSYTFENLESGTRYYARVNADDGEWSSVVDFTTEQASGTAPSITAIADQTYVYGANEGIFTLPVTASGDPAPTFSVASADAPAGSFTIGPNDGQFLFEPEATGTFHFTVTAANGVSPDATDSFAVTVTGTAPVVTVTPATYSYNVTVGDPYVEFTVTASGNPAPVLTDSCTESAYYVFENNAFLFELGTAGTYHFVFTASNSEGTDSKTVTVTVTAPVVSVPVLTIDNETSTTADASWTAVTGTSSYILQLASDPNFTVGGTGQTLTLFDNPATTPGTAPIGWTYNIRNSSGTYLQLTTTNHFVLSDTFDTSACVNMTLSLKARTYGGTAEGTTNLLVQYTTDNGVTWHEIGTVSASTDSLANKELNASAAIGHSSVRFRFSVPGAASGKGLGISALLLTGKETSATGSLISTTTVSGTNSTFSGLSPDTIYYARVKADGGEWSDVVDFLTDSGSSAGESFEIAFDDDSADTSKFYVLGTVAGHWYELVWTSDLTAGFTNTNAPVQATSDLMEFDFPETDGTWFGRIHAVPNYSP